MVRVLTLLAAALLLAFHAEGARAQSTDPADQVCQRFAPGSVLPAPADLKSQNGVLELTLQFKTTVDQQGLTRYCYVTDTGLESPTLHVSPGDQLIIHFQNTLAANASMSAQSRAKVHGHAANDGPNNDCAGGAMGATTTNLHFHGLNVAPTCHQDEVITTLVQPSESFDYTVQIPSDEPTGLYWYHPHPHGFSTGQVLGGAAGALIVDGIENVNPLVANLTQRLFVLRDQRLPPPAAPPPPPGGPQGPGLDLSVNFVPVTAPAYTTPIVQTAAGASEFWRVLNAASNTQVQLQYVIGGVAQPLQVVALDGVPIGQGTGAIQTLTQTSIVLGPGARAEFIAVTPKAGQQGQLLTQAVDTGAGGLVTPTRPLASIVPQAGSTSAAARLGAVRTAVRMTRFANLNTTSAASRRLLYFSESAQGGPEYYITVQGQTPTAYEMGAPPAIVLHQGVTEEWIVENRALEDHVFHIHQTRFQTLAIDGQAVSDPALRDTITVPHWSGSGPYPSVKLLIDFRPANIVGTFVYHCHILSHEDLGMMQAVQVLPGGVATTTVVTASPAEATLSSPVAFTAAVSPGSAGAPLAGTVQFFDGDAALGNPVAVQNGRAVLTAQLPAYGSHVIAAAYSGDATRNQSLSAGTTVAVEDFALSAQALTIRQGDSGSVPVAVTTSPGFSSVMNFSCSLPEAATGATCEVSPASLAASGTFTLTVRTRAPLTAAHLGTLPAVLAAILMLALPYRGRRRVRSGVMLLGALTLLSSCGGSSQSADSGTPTGSYTISLKGSCAADASPISHVVSVPLKIT